MKAVAIHKHGGVEALQFEELPDPAVGAGEVRVRLRAAALNHVDLFVRRGWRGLTLAFPHVLGADGSGTVESVGPGVENLAPGDRVVVNPGLNCGTCPACRAGEDSLCDTYSVLGEHRDGTYAELVTLPARNVLPLAETLSFEEAAALPLVFMTAWRMLVDRARVQPQETVLVLGAGGGVASAAIQVAKVLGARVIATSSSAEKLEKAQAIGADEVINYREEPFERVAWTMTEKRGVDVVVETVGEATWPKSLRTLGRNGRLVTCGATTGPLGETDIRLIFGRQLRVYGSFMGTRAGLEEVLRLAAEGRLRALVHQALPLQAARQAHEILEAGTQFGKVVLTP